jgi:hypothetical protein
MGKLSNIMLGNSIPVKYGDPGNPILTIQINGVNIPNVLVDLGATINFITSATTSILGLHNFKPTPTIPELTDRSIVKPIGKLEGITISVDSWQFLVDILVLQTQSPFGGHPWILGRPCIAKKTAYIGCRSRNMVIYNGGDTKNLILYSPAEPSSSKGPRITLLWKSSPIKGLEIDEEIIPILKISEALCFRNETEDDTINTFISNSDSGNRKKPLLGNIQI